MMFITVISIENLMMTKDSSCYYLTAKIRYEKAVHAFRQAISIDRNNADALLSLAETLLRRMGHRLVCAAMNRSMS